jgi:hypothetical protein
MLERLDNYDWEEAFAYANPQPTAGYTGRIDRFVREDVAEIIAIDDGENEGRDWVGVFHLKDGRFAFLSAGCDYTGWDCQAGGSSWVAADLPSLIRWGLRAEDRERLKLPLVS